MNGLPAWHPHPDVWVLVAVLAGAYLMALRSEARRRPAGSEPPAKTGQKVAFIAGVATILLASDWPVHDLAEGYLYSAHMVQHLLLTLVAAPLLAYARPAAALVAGLPAAGRDVVRQAGTGGLRQVGHALARPLVVWAVGALALWAWHMPSLYEAALAHDALHVVEHASFLGVAVLFWSLVVNSGRRRGVARPVAALLVFANGVQGTALGAVLLFASTPLYPGHDAGAALWGRSPMDDQQLAGALMWAPPAVVYVATVGWLLYRWFEEMADAYPDPVLAAAGEGL